jgi:hypothetical protein
MSNRLGPPIRAAVRTPVDLRKLEVAEFEMYDVSYLAPRALYDWRTNTWVHADLVMTRVGSLEQQVSESGKPGTMEARAAFESFLLAEFKVPPEFRDLLIRIARGGHST